VAEFRADLRLTVLATDESRRDACTRNLPGRVLGDHDHEATVITGGGPVADYGRLDIDCGLPFSFYAVLALAGGYASQYTGFRRLQNLPRGF
jgi:hypothetical protein